MKTIGVVTTSRADFGLYRPIIKRILADDALELFLYAAGPHLSPEFGLTVGDIEAEGFSIHERIEMLVSSDTPQGTAKSMGLGLIGFAQAFEKKRPDILLVLGDRFEMFTAVAAALPFNIPVAHIHGGEITEGAMDDALRHAMTKMSHLHFAATEEYAARIRRLGEEPWRVTVSGAPGLDNLKDFSPLSDQELASRFGLDLSKPTLLVTYHPVTRAPDGGLADLGELLAALAATDLRLVFTYPNADAGGRAIIAKIQTFAVQHPGVTVAPHLGTAAYFTLMSRVAAMAGNSSSGLIEAASFELPVVNVGTRQQGRVRGKNVIDAPGERNAIKAALNKAVSSDFRARLSGMDNPYGDGCAAERIVEALRQADPAELAAKKFHDPSSDKQGGGR